MIVVFIKINLIIQTLTLQCTRFCEIWGHCFAIFCSFSIFCFGCETGLKRDEKAVWNVPLQIILLTDVSDGLWFDFKLFFLLCFFGISQLIVFKQTTRFYDSMLRATRQGLHWWLDMLLKCDYFFFQPAVMAKVMGS